MADSKSPAVHVQQQVDSKSTAADARGPSNVSFISGLSEWVSDVCEVWVH